MESLPDEIVLHLCDISHDAYMALYRVNKRYHVVLSAYRSSMMLRHLVPMHKYTRIFNGSQDEHYYHTTGETRNGAYKRETVHRRIYSSEITVQSIVGGYRNGVEHGIWTESANKNINKIKTYDNGVLKSCIIYEWGIPKKQYTTLKSML